MKEIQQIFIHEAAFSSLSIHLKNAYPREGCGLLLSEGDKPEIVRACPMENMERKDAANTGFWIRPKDLLMAENELLKEGFEISGFYHSHPDCPAIPSDRDREYMIPGMLYVIARVNKDGIESIKGYRSNEKGIMRDECICISNT